MTDFCDECGVNLKPCPDCHEQTSVSAVASNDGLNPAFVAKAIDDEPELEGEMPDGIWETIKTKKDLQAYSVMLVHLTKKAIKERLGV